MSTPSLIYVEANYLSDSDDDATEVEILGDTTHLGPNLFEDLVDKYGESYMDEVMEVECDGRTLSH